VLRPQLTYSRAADGAIVMTTDAHGLFIFGALQSPINATAGQSAWTGLFANWTNHPDQCVGWSSQDGADPGRFGDTNATDGKVLAQQQGPCSSALRLICVEQ
jgi:hypothetical protein